MPKVVNIRHAKTGTYTRVDRKTRWGNPYRVGQHGTLQQVLPLYSDWIFSQKDLLENLHELEGQDLGCWCAPPQGLSSDLEKDPLLCHAQILMFLVEQNRNIRQEMEQRLNLHE